MIVIITARKGSKRCPNKNTMPFSHGKSILDQCIQKAVKMDANNVVVTTDIDIYETHFESPTLHEKFIWHVRSPALCGEDVSSVDVVLDVVERLGKDQESLCLLQPTNPLITTMSLKDAEHRFNSKELKALIAVGPDYKPCGAFYFVRMEDFLEQKTFFVEGASFYYLPTIEAIDINFPWDFRIAQAVMAGRIYGWERG